MVQSWAKVRTTTLDSIQEDFIATQHRLRELLKAWLNTGDNPSWKTLVDALRSPVVGASQLAAALETKYCSEILFEELIWKILLSWKN